MAFDQLELKLYLRTFQVRICIKLTSLTCRHILIPIELVWIIVIIQPFLLVVVGGLGLVSRSCLFDAARWDDRAGLGGDDFGNTPDAHGHVLGATGDHSENIMFR